MRRLRLLGNTTGQFYRFSHRSDLIPPQGGSRLDVDGSFVQIEAGYQGGVYAVSSENVLNYRIGICAIHPTGSASKQVEGLLVQHVTVGDGSLSIIAISTTVFRST